MALRSTESGMFETNNNRTRTKVCVVAHQLLIIVDDIKELQFGISMC